MPTIAVVTRKGGSGKTTISTAIAGYLAAGDVPTGILDLDPQGSASAWAAARGDERAKVLGVRSRPATLREDLRRMGASGVAVTVVDTPPHSDAALAGAIEVADVIVLPSLPSAFDLHALSSAVGSVKAAGRRGGVVLNCAIPNTIAIAEAKVAVAEMGLPLLGVLHRRMVWQYAAARGLSPAELDSRSEATAELNALCGAILNLIES